MLPRRILTALLGVTLVVALVGCGDDDDSEGGDTTTTTAATSTTDSDESDESTSSESEPESTVEGPETSTSEPTSTDDDSTTTEEATTSTPGDGGSDEECAGYQEIADASEAMDDLGFDDWEAIQSDYPALAGDVIAGIDRALTAVEGSLAVDLELMRGVIQETIELAATSSSMEEFYDRASSATGGEEADAAADRVEAAAEARCGIVIS